MSQEVPHIDPTRWFAFQDRSIIAPDEAEEKTKGGIIIPDTAKEKPKSGIVVLVGPEVKGYVKIGDHVHYGRHAGQPITIDGFTFDSVRISELIIGVAKEDTPSNVRNKAIMNT